MQISTIKANINLILVHPIIIVILSTRADLTQPIYALLVEEGVMPDSFEILHKDLAGRIGRLRTPHGSIETPALMPVINPHLQIIPARELKGMGASIMITNSYIINQDQKLKGLALEKGLHSLLGFDGPIMTDSGAFQLSVYGDVNVQPLEILQFQDAIGSDISVPLDIPTPPDVPRDRAESELQETERRLYEALEHRGSSLLAGPIQGGTYTDLREAAARHLSDKGFDIYPIGAVVPLMETYRFSDLVDVVAAAKKGLGPGAPVHLFGAGHPMVFALAAALGCDLFDSAAYALYARQDRYLSPRGTMKLADMSYLPCSCDVCRTHTARELLQSPDKSKLLAAHNLNASFEEMNLVKQCIREGSLWDLLEMRCRSHPRMIDGLKCLSSKVEWLEGLDTSSKSTFFYLGPDSAERPEVIRYSRRISRLYLCGDVLITNDPNANIAGFDHVLHFKPPFGPYPHELSETYPLNAEVPQHADRAAMRAAMDATEHLIEANPQARFQLQLRSAPEGGK
jgi:7-cyano-7-deazaguanine tRNA-ribosyltransferase